MNKRKDLLTAICNRVKRKEKSFIADLTGFSDKKLRAILKFMADYYEVNDFETSYVHSRIFKTLYLDATEYSYDKIAEMYHIHCYTLDRYRQKYNRLAKQLIKKARNKNPAA